MFEFIKGYIGKVDKKIHESYNNLPVDPFQISSDKPFRYRRFSKARFYKANFKIITDTNFFQDYKYNHYVGGKIRNYESIDKIVYEKFIKIFKSEFLNKIDLKKFELGLHQIRINCGLNFVGYPVPEGWHKDGFDYVIMLNISSTNILGGITRIRKKFEDNYDHFSCLLNEGQYVMIDDHLFYHFTDPINVNKNKKKGFRDTLVITIKNLL